MVRLFFKGYKRFFLDVGHVMRIILLCEAAETSKRSRTDLHHLIDHYVHRIMLHKTHRWWHHISFCCIVVQWIFRLSLLSSAEPKYWIGEFPAKSKKAVLMFWNFYVFFSQKEHYVTTYLYLSVWFFITMLCVTMHKYVHTCLHVYLIKEYSFF